LKKAKPLSTQIALDFAPSDFITRINELEMQLSAEKEKNNVRRELLLMRIGLKDLEAFGRCGRSRTPRARPITTQPVCSLTAGCDTEPNLWDVRFNEIGGFNSKQIEQNIGRVFESGNPVEPKQRCLLLHHISSLPAFPDYFLFAVTSDRTGQLPSIVTVGSRTQSRSFL